MKKVILLIIVVLFVSGCNAEYNLVIEGDNLKEELIINAENIEESDSIELNERDYSAIVGEDTLLYSKEKEKVSDAYRMILSYGFDRGNIRTSKMVNTCFDSVIVTNTSTMLRTLTSNYNKCFDLYTSLNNLTINIKTPNEVTFHNADKVNDGVYTWNVSRKNHKDKPIQLVMSNNLAPTNGSIAKSDNNTLIIIVAIGAILIIGGGLGYMIFQKKKKVKLVTPE